MDSLRIGFIGSGFIARFMAVAMQQVRDCEVTAIYRRSGSEQLAAEVKALGLSEPRICDSIRELCEVCDTAAVFTPNHTRVAVMEEIAEAAASGAAVRNVIGEKPLGRTVQEARRLLELAAKAGLKTAYFENQIYMNAVNNALDQLRDQRRTMGEVVLVRATEEHAGPHEAWFWDPTRQGGGVLCDMGCHSIAVARYILTPEGKDPMFLEPVAVQADTALLKWGQARYRDQLRARFGVDYATTPAEDFATGIITFRNPESGQLVRGQFTNSWMYDKQGLRVSIDAHGPGYGMEFNSLRSPLEVFVGDEAAESVADAERAVEKSTATRGLLAVHPNEVDLYGYTTEMRKTVDSFRRGENAYLTWEYGLEITRLVQAAYMAAERGKTIDLTDDSVLRELEIYQSPIAQGKGAELLY